MKLFKYTIAALLISAPIFTQTRISPVNIITDDPIGLEDVPVIFNMAYNFPNPYNPVTKIRFVLYESVDYKFTVMDVTGKVVYNLNEFRQAGTYEMTFDGSSLSSGVYFYRLESKGFSDTKKMVLLR